MSSDRIDDFVLIKRLLFRGIHCLRYQSLDFIYFLWLVNTIMLIHCQDCGFTLRFGCFPFTKFRTIFSFCTKSNEFKCSHAQARWIWIWTQRRFAFELGSLALPNSWFLYTFTVLVNKHGRMNPCAKVLWLIRIRLPAILWALSCILTLPWMRSA